MSDQTLFSTSVHARTLPEHFQALYGQISRGFDPLHREAFLDVKVTAAKDGYVLLTVALPEGMTRGFMTFLDAMHGLMRCADQQAARALREAAPLDVQAMQQVEQLKGAFRTTICTRFDELSRQGVTSSEAVKRINAELKADGHPWAGHEAVRSILSTAGRFRKKASPSPPKTGAVE
jgi:hypothetical protein